MDKPINDKRNNREILIQEYISRVGKKVFNVINREASNITFANMSDLDMSVAFMNVIEIILFNYIIDISDEYKTRLRLAERFGKSLVLSIEQYETQILGNGKH
jgi:hypothetical protein